MGTLLKALQALEFGHFPRAWDPRIHLGHRKEYPKGIKSYRGCESDELPWVKIPSIPFTL